MRHRLRHAALAGCLVLGAAAPAFAQGDVIAARREGLRGMNATLEAVQAAVQSRSDARALLPQIDAMTTFFQGFPQRFPAASLTPPVAQGTQPGQTRARDTIETNRAGFQQANANMVAQIARLRNAAASGSISADMLRTTGGTCGACHRDYRAR
jgi:cytochrome c556